MGQQARVRSFDAIGDLAAALRCFQHEASQALEALQQAIQRAVEWVEQDQKQYWMHELRRSERQVQEAKINLQRCLSFKRIGEHRPACIEEKRALERAKRREQVSREKLEAVRKWAPLIERAVFEYKGGVHELGQWLEVDAERTLALLGRIRHTLEQYAAAGSPPQAAEAAAEALARLPWTEKPQQKAEGPQEAAGEQRQEEGGPAEEEGQEEEEQVNEKHRKRGAP